MKILGLDLATKKAGYCIMDSNKNIINVGLLRTESSETKDRMEELYFKIGNIIKENSDIEIVVFEDVPVNTHNNIKTGKDLSILQGVILSLVFQNNLKYKMYNPSAWRSKIGTYDGTRQGMKRDVQKRKSVEMVNNIYNLDYVYNETETKTRTTDDDKAEAILIARAYLIDIENKEE